MSFSRAKPAGWAFGEILTSAQMNTVDTNQSRGVDGNAGGAYTPSAQIDLQGTGGGAGSALNLQNFPTVDSQTVTRVQPLTPMFGEVGSGWELAVSWYWGTSGGWVQSGSNVTLFVPISNVVDLSSLIKVRLYFSGSYSSLPASQPTLDVQYFNNTGTLVTATPTVQDAQGSVGAFNAFHNIEVTLDTPISINQASASAITPWVRFVGVGTGFEDNDLIVKRIEADFTVTRLTP